VLTDPAVKPFGATAKKTSKKVVEAIFYISLVVQEGVNCRIQSAPFSGPSNFNFQNFRYLCLILNISILGEGGTEFAAVLTGTYIFGILAQK
jgi:hypothetical protein